jgi:hypothetical protein
MTTTNIAIATCTICVDNFNYGNRKRVVCESCQLEACSKCIKKYLSENVQHPHCMQCKEVYSKTFMDNSFSMTYRKQILKELRETILANEEKKVLPDLMPRAEAYKKSNEIYEIIKEKEKLSRNLRTTITTKELNIKSYMTFHGIDNDVDKIKDEYSQIEQLNKDWRSLLNEIDDLYTIRSKYYEEYHHGGKYSVKRIVKCVSENCRGFYNDDFHCALCNTTVCKDCHEVLEDGHECKEENIQSVKLIQEETRPCPSCQTSIAKAEGCNQMWCTKCHTTFDWVSGIIDTGRVHNPHYLEWLRKRNNMMPREMGDVPCGGLPNLVEIEFKFEELQIPFPYWPYISIAYNLTDKIQNVEVQRYPVQIGRTEEMNLLSIQYLIGDINERVWKSKLFQHAKSREMNQEKRLVFDMLLACLIDYYRTLATAESKDEFLHVLDEIEYLRVYFNECMSKLSRRFDVFAYKYIPKDWAKLKSKSF